MSAVDLPLDSQVDSTAEEQRRHQKLCDVWRDPPDSGDGFTKSIIERSGNATSSPLLYFFWLAGFSPP